MSSCFQILLVPLCWSEGELEPGVSSGSFKETVFRVRFPFLLLHGSFSSGQRRTTPPTEPGFSQGFFLHSVTILSGLLSWGHFISSDIVDLVAQILFKLNRAG